MARKRVELVGRSDEVGRLLRILVNVTAATQGQPLRCRVDRVRAPHSVNKLMNDGLA